MPQSVVHGFRTVVNDGGAELAAASTNVRLITWSAFQAEFEPTWVRHYLRPTVAERLDPLLTYTEPINSAAFRKFDLLTKAEKEHFSVLRRRYTPFGVLMMAFTPYVAMFADRPLPALPIRIPSDVDLHESLFPDGFFEAAGYADLLDLALPFGEAAIEELRLVLQPDGGPDWDPTKA